MKGGDKLNRIGMLTQQSAYQPNTPFDNKMSKNSSKTNTLFFENLLSDEKGRIQDQQLSSEQPSQLNKGEGKTDPVDRELAPAQTFDTRFRKINEKAEVILADISTDEDIANAAPKLLELLRQFADLEKRSADILSLMETDGTKLNAVWRELILTFKEKEQLSVNQQENPGMDVTIADVSEWLHNTLEVQNKTVGNRERATEIGINQFMEINTKAEAILSTVSTEEDIANAAPKLLELVKQWTNVESKESDKLPIMKSIKTELNPMWKKLIASLQIEPTSMYLQQQTDSSITVKDVSEWLTKWMENIPAVEENRSNVIYHEPFPVHVVDISEKPANIEPIQITKLHSQLSEIYTKASMVLSDIAANQDIVKAAPKLLEMLRQWVNLEKRSPESQVVPLLENDGTKLSSLWKDLVASFQKREQFSISGPYRLETQVTAKDIAGWLGKTMEANPIRTENTVQYQAPGVQMMPLSKLEQYVIHLNQMQGSPAQNQSFMDQFQQAIISSKFLTQPNGINQLQITLHPNNLGEMMLRLTEINGEMTVKIVVTSATAKEMLESNIHQLKNMFSPHQVQIEKQDEQLLTNQHAQKNKENDEFNEQDEHSSNHSNEDNNEQTDDEFESYFQELLLNEKV